MIVANPASIPDHAANLRRLMARAGMTLAELVRQSGLDHRTLKGILSGRHRPQPRTLHRLAATFNVPVEELFQDAALLRHRLFDRRTNPVVEEVISDNPWLFHGWTQDEFYELYSRFGTGGALTEQGTVKTAQAMNKRRKLLQKVTLLLETNESELLETMIEALYSRATVQSPENGGANQAVRTAP